MRTYVSITAAKIIPPQKNIKKQRFSVHMVERPHPRFYTMPRIQCHASRGERKERQTGHKKEEEEEEEENKRETEETRNVSSTPPPPFLTLLSLSSEPFRAEKALSRAFFDCVFDSRVGAGPSSLLLVLLLFSNFLVAARSNSLCVSLRRSKMPFSLTLCPHLFRFSAGERHTEAKFAGERKRGRDRYKKRGEGRKRCS